MSAANYDILIEQGATFTMTLTLKDVTAVPINLTGLTFRGKLKKDFSDVVEIANFSFNVLNQNIAENLGKVEVTLTATQTAAISAPAKGTVRTLTTLVYDIETQDGVGFVTRWLQGLAKVSPEVTK